MYTGIIPCGPRDQLDPLAQLVEHLTFNQGVLRSSRRWITPGNISVSRVCDSDALFDLSNNARKQGSGNISVTDGNIVRPLLDVTRDQF